MCRCRISSEAGRRFNIKILYVHFLSLSIGVFSAFYPILTLGVCARVNGRARLWDKERTKYFPIEISTTYFCVIAIWWLVSLTIFAHTEQTLALYWSKNTMYGAVDEPGENQLQSSLLDNSSLSLTQIFLTIFSKIYEIFVEMIGINDKWGTDVKLRKAYNALSIDLSMKFEWIAWVRQREIHKCILHIQPPNSKSYASYVYREDRY